MDKHKYCCVCEQSFPATTEFFHKRHDSIDGLRCDCKNCRKNNNKKDYNKPFKRCTDCHELLPNTSEYFYRLTHGKNSANRSQCRKCHAEYQKWQKRLTSYGISKEQYLKMYQNQEGICPICKNRYEVDLLCVDHCHTSGKVRALLCNNCNTGIAMLKENEDVLLSAIDYLKYYHTPKTE